MLISHKWSIDMRNSQFYLRASSLSLSPFPCETLPVWIPAIRTKIHASGGSVYLMSDVTLDDVDRGILFLLQNDARNITIAEVAEQVNVAASTVRNRIEDMEETGVIEGYFPKINYEQANYPLHVLFVCSAPADEREELAANILDQRGVVDVREMLTSKRNIYIEVVATDTRDLTEITNELAKMGFSVESSEIITNHYTRPWAEFEFEKDEE